MQCLGQCGCGVLARAHVLSLVSAQERALESKRRGIRKNAAASRRRLLLADTTRQMAC